MESDERFNYEFIFCRIAEFPYPYDTMEEKLKDADVLLIHPGTPYQNLVIGVYPSRFPNLTIGLVSDFGEDYHPEAAEGRVRVLNYSKPEEIVQFCLNHITKLE